MGKAMSTKSCQFPLVWLLFALLLTSCARMIPQASEEVLEHKKAVLVVTSGSMDEAARQTAGNVLRTWSDAHSIAYEALHDVGALDAVIGRIAGKPYDYIFVVGNDLFASALGASRAMEGRFVLLSDRYAAERYEADSAMVWTFGADRLNKLRNDWVRQQAEAGHTVQWITEQKAPIPAQWLPAGSADDAVFMIDLYGDQWLDALVARVKEKKPRWLALYRPLPADRMNSLRALNIPIYDLAAVPPVTVRWEAVWQQQLDMMLNDRWQAGVFTYADNQWGFAAN